jgi:hypothetical protein
MSHIAFFNGVFAYKLFCYDLCDVLERDLVCINVEQNGGSTGEEI